MLGAHNDWKVQSKVTVGLIRTADQAGLFVSLGVPELCMYCRQAALCHLPRVWIDESAIPATTVAVVAAPIRKL